MQAMPSVPKWQEIPQIITQAHIQMAMNQLPLDSIIAILEVCFVALRQRVESHMFSDMGPNEIMQFGSKLTECDKALENASTALILNENAQAATQNTSLVFKLIQGIWNDLETFLHSRDEVEQYHHLEQT